MNCINDEGASPTFVASELSRLRVLQVTTLPASLAFTLDMCSAHRHDQNVRVKLLVKSKGDVNASVYRRNEDSATCLEVATQVQILV